MLCAPLVLHPGLTLQRGWATLSALRLCSDRSHVCLRNPRPMQEATVTQAAMRNSRRHLSELKDYKDPVTLEREFLSTTRQLRAKGLSDSQATSASKVPETDAGSGGTNRPISYTQTVSRKFHKYHHSGAYVSCWRPRCALCLCITCPAAERRAWLTVGSRVWSRCAGEEQVRGRRVRVVLLHGIQEERARVHCDDCEPGRVQLRQHQLTRPGVKRCRHLYFVFSSNVPTAPIKVKPPCHAANSAHSSVSVPTTRPPAISYGRTRAIMCGD